MINLNDFIVKVTKRKNGYIDKCKLYKSSCSVCNKDKGYVTKSRYNNKPNCIKCATNTLEHRDTLKSNHWKNKGISSSAWMKKDPNSPLRVRIGNNLRSRLYLAIKGNYKSGSAVNDLGCSIDEFTIYLESKWQMGMTWDNWSRKGWHLDHIKPLASFDLTNREQFLEACHYTNLQPLWAKDNLKKSDKVITGIIELRS